MDYRRSSSSLSLLLLLLIQSSCFLSISSISDENPLIRQVISDSDQSVTMSESTVLNAEAHFTTFLKKYGKSYGSTDEHSRRFGVFKANMWRAKKHQMLDPTAVHGVTQFSDLTPEEFEEKYLGLRVAQPDFLKGDQGVNKAPVLPTDDLPDDFDWRDHGAVTAVKNQVRFRHLGL